MQVEGLNFRKVSHNYIRTYINIVEQLKSYIELDVEWFIKNNNFKDNKFIKETIETYFYMYRPDTLNEQERIDQLVLNYSRTVQSFKDQLSFWKKRSKEDISNETMKEVHLGIILSFKVMLAYLYNIHPVVSSVVQRNKNNRDNIPKLFELAKKVLEESENLTRYSKKTTHFDLFKLENSYVEQEITQPMCANCNYSGFGWEGEVYCLHDGEDSLEVEKDFLGYCMGKYEVSRYGICKKYIFREEKIQNSETN